MSSPKHGNKAHYTIHGCRCHFCQFKSEMQEQMKLLTRPDSPLFPRDILLELGIDRVI